MGRIAASKGSSVEIDLAVASISGLDLVKKNTGFSLAKRKSKLHGMYKTKSFSHKVDEKYFGNIRNKGKNPYNPIFDEAAIFVISLLEKFDSQQIDNLTKLTDMRFAASFSEDAFSEHMEVKNGLVTLTSLPSEDDGMFQKVRALRVRTSS